MEKSLMIFSILYNEETLPKQLGCLVVDANITPKFYTLRNTSVARTTSPKFNILYMIHIYFVFPFCFTGHYLTRNKNFVAFETIQKLLHFLREIWVWAVTYLVSSGMHMYNEWSHTENLICKLTSMAWQRKINGSLENE